VLHGAEHAGVRRYACKRRIEGGARNAERLRLTPQRRKECIESRGLPERPAARQRQC